MADLVDQYLDRLTVRNFSQATIKAYRQDLRHAEAAIGKPLLRATEEDLETYIAGLHRAGLKATTIRRRQSSLRGFYDHCRRKKRLKVKPSDNFEPPKTEERLPIYLTPGQVERLLEATEGDSPQARRDAAIIGCLYFTGMRSGELLGLTFRDIFLDDREIRVFGKGKKERLLPMPEQLARLLKRWVEVHPTGDGPLFVGVRHPSAPLEYPGMRRVVAEAMKRAGLAGRKFTPHKLRHTFATRLVNRKVSIDKIQKLLGHRRIETTSIYTHTQLEDELRNAIGEALE